MQTTSVIGTLKEIERITIIVSVVFYRYPDIDFVLIFVICKQCVHIANCTLNALHTCIVL